LESVLAQTFTDFEIIISDNASTDSTRAICLEFAEKDERIQYTRQDKNIGVNHNLHFTVKKAVGKYFMWAPSDDYFLPEYIKKNIDILELNETVVSCTSDFRWFYVDGEYSNEDEMANNERKDIQYTRSYYGTRDERVNSFLKNFGTFEMYAVHRTNKLQEDFVPPTFWMWDHACALNMVKHGNYHALDEILTYKYTKGVGRGTINSISNQNVPLLHMIFLAYPFISWCAKTFGIKILSKHGLYFFKTFLRGEYIVIAESIRMIKRMIFRQERHW
jgi:glycosyltransferase involved in cell wall biosynthesis